ncbi:MAG: patatin-like phospholipase family protein [Herminiimonas sp.]|nr:patatin-like phospholipase family protein [Herminiimonas sp.]
MASLRKRGPHRGDGAAKSEGPILPGQVVLVLQGGGALGAYHAGVYQALHEAGIEPAWVIGTSIGAINGALIAGNPPENRLDRLRTFWKSVEQKTSTSVPDFFPVLRSAMVNLMTMAGGIPTFFAPNPMALLGQHASVGIEHAAYYTTAPLRETLAKLVDFDYINHRHMRISLGAVKVSDGEMTYFDSREEAIRMEHVMASGALPPAFPAIRIGDDFYWDGGIYSNTPVEAVLDDKPRRDSLIFTVDVWNPEGAQPETLWQVAGREKDIQYASRVRSHIARQKQIHHLRHIISELAKAMPEKKRNSPEIRELASWGCRTTIHVARLVAAGIAGEDQMKDIDFTPAGIRARWHAGYADTRRMLDLSPWNRPADPIEGVIIHDLSADAATPLAAGVDGFEGKTK